MTQHQTILLKILDSYLQSTRTSATSNSASKVVDIYKNLRPLLASTFFDLSDYTLQAIGRALRPSVVKSFASNPPDLSGSVDNESVSSTRLLPTELDAMLPKVCEALVLVTQCIVTITLGTDQHGNAERECQAHEAESDFRDFFIGFRSSGVGMVQSLIELLRQLDRFLPKIQFGKPVLLPGEEKLVNSTSGVTGFGYLKRDLVRLLGVLTHGSKVAQDDVRQQGGIEVILNLCVIDERNPYLREHAILALHSVLKNNPDNQALVHSIQPVEKWDEEGNLESTSSDLRC